MVPNEASGTSGNDHVRRFIGAAIQTNSILGVRGACVKLMTRSNVGIMAICAP